MKRRNNKSIIFGLALSALAILLLLSSINVITGGIIHISISVLMVTYGISALLSKSYFMGLYSIAFGFRYSAVYYKHIIDLTKVNYWQLFLIMTILAIGLQMLFGHRKRNYYHFEGNFDIPAGRERSNVGEEYVNIQTYLKETTRYIYSANLEVVDLKTQLGSTSVFFQEKNLNRDLNIYVDCKLGNLELYIPKEWIVVESISTNLGHVDIDYNRDTGNIMSPHKVYIEGNVSLGNIEIHFI